MTTTLDSTTTAYASHVEDPTAIYAVRLTARS